LKSIASAPGKIILFGEHFVVHGTKAILAAINKRVTVTSAFTDNNTIKVNEAFIQDYIVVDGIANKPITISSAIRDNEGATIGMLVFEIKPESIDNIMLNEDPANGLGNSGETYLVGSDSLMRSSSRLTLCLPSLSVSINSLIQPSA